MADRLYTKINHAWVVKSPPLKKILSAVPLFCIAILFAQHVSASKYHYPDISGPTTFSGGGTYCQNTATSLIFTYSSTSCNYHGGGGNVHVLLKVRWYSNTSSSTTGGTLVYATNSTDGAGALTYTPPTSSVGTTYYYVVISWDAQGCAASQESLTSSSAQAIRVKALPASFTVTGGGSYCSGEKGVSIGLSGSASYVNYQLLKDGVSIGSPVAGSGSAINFGNQTGTGTYTIVAISASAGCMTTMDGSTTINLKQASAGGTLPSVWLYSNGKGTLTLSGYTGTIQHWESSADQVSWATIANSTNLQAYSATTETVYYRVWVQNSTCNGAYSNIDTVAVVNHWTGKADNQWNNAANWSGHTLPADSGKDIYIDSTMKQPEIDGTVNVDNLQISSGAGLTIGATGNLVIGGSIIESSPGSISASTGTVTLNGTSAQTIPANTFVNNALNNLVIANPGTSGVSLGGELDIYNSVSFSGTGKILATNDYLTLKSNDSGTARVGDLTGNTLTGNVTTERYIESKKAWRFLSVPVNTSETIQQAWQEGATSTTANPKPHFGIQLSGPGGTSAGFDLYSGSPSMKTYNSATGTWEGVPNTNNTSIKSTGGYMVFIRGDRTASSITSPVSSTTLRAKGPLYTGTLPAIPVAAGKFTSIGNPYSSAIDMRNISRSGVKDFFYVWDPMLSGTNGYGGYQTFSSDGRGNYVITPGGGSYGPAGSISNYIQSGQAFFVQGGSTGGSLTFSESSKASGSSIVNTPEGAPLPQLRATLIGVNGDKSTYIADGTLVNFGDTYSNSIDDMDALKSANGSENLSIKRNNKLLVVERRHTITTNDTIFLNMTGVSVSKYELEIYSNQLGLSAVLIDNYLKTGTPVNVTGVTDVTFSVTGAAASYAPDRFMIVLSPTGTLPVSFTSVEARPYRSAVDVQWQVAQEMNIDHYEAERSLDGTSFTRISRTAAEGNSGNSATYVVTDNHPVAGSDYYRVKSVDVNQRVAYSSVVKVSVQSSGEDIAVFPNPVINGRINLQIENQLAGKYIVRLFSKTGQLIIQQDLQKSNAPLRQTIQVDAGLPHDIYNLQIIKPDNTTRQIKLEF